MRKLILTVIFISTVAASFGGAPALYPAVGETVLTKGRGQGSFMVFNTGETVKRYRIGVRETDNQGEESLLGEYLRVFPTYVEVEPGSNKRVRYLIRGFPQEDAADGEYRASISIEELDSSLEDRHKTKETARGISTVINYRYHINMAVYGYVGELYEDAEVEMWREEGIAVGRIRNKGNYSYPVYSEFYGSRGEFLNRVPLPKLMDGGEAEFSIEVPEGAAVIKITGGDEGRILYENEV